MPTTATVRTRSVITANRVEIHAESCGCRIPRNAEVFVGEQATADIAETHAEAVDLNDGPSPVKPCLRRAAGIR